MRMPLLVTAPGVNDSETSRQKAAAPPGFHNDISGKAAHLRQESAVVIYQRPELAGDGEGDVLPFSVRHQSQQVLYPDFPGFYAAVGAGAAFAAETDFFV